MKHGSDIYGGHDPRSLPAYSVEQAAHYVRVPRPTLARWVTPKVGIIKLPAANRRLLSFWNLAEAHVLASIRVAGVPLQRVRKAVRAVQRELPGVDHPLIAKQFETDGLDLFVKTVGDHYMNLTADDGQLYFGDLMRMFLKRIEADEKGLARRLFPFIRDEGYDIQGTPIVIDPRVSFGQPIVNGTGIAVAAIADRFRAGESVKHLAGDYRVSADLIEDAIRAAA